MGNVNILNKLILFENIMGVYRNYALLKGKRKFSAIIYIILTVTWHSWGLYYICQDASNIIHLKNFTYSCFLLLYYLVTTLNTFAAIILSCIYSKHFDKIIFNVKTIHKLFDDDDSYKKAMLRLKKRFTKAAALSFAQLFWFTFIFLRTVMNVGYTKLKVIPDLGNMVMQWRFLFANFFFKILIEVMIAPLEFIISSVSAATIDAETGNTEELRKIGVKLEKWGEASKLLVNTSCRLRTCFGFQVSLSQLIYSTSK